jgi:hypothetical protein
VCKAAESINFVDWIIGLPNGVERTLLGVEGLFRADWRRRSVRSRYEAHDIFFYHHT